MRRTLIVFLLGAFGSAPAAALASAAKEEKPAAGAYLPLPTLTASLLRGDGRRRVLTVQAGLETADAKLRERAALSQPRLRDAYVSALSAYGASTPALGPPDPDAIGAALQRATDQVLGRSGARVLLGSIMVN